MTPSGGGSPDPPPPRNWGVPRSPPSPDLGGQKKKKGGGPPRVKKFSSGASRHCFFFFLSLKTCYHDSWFLGVLVHKKKKSLGKFPMKMYVLWKNGFGKVRFFFLRRFAPRSIFAANVSRRGVPRVLRKSGGTWCRRGVPRPTPSPL